MIYPLPTPHYSPPQLAPSIIRPTSTSLYNVWTGAIHYNESNGKVFKDGRSTDVTTLLTFEFLSESKGKTCTFYFDSSSDATTKVSSTS